MTAASGPPTLYSAAMNAWAEPAPPVEWEGDQAWKNVLGHPHSRWFAERASRHWPATAASRLERAIVLPEVRPSFSLGPEDRVFTIGSCFARNIENHLMAQGFQVESQLVDIPGLEFRPPHSSVVLNKFTSHSMLNELRWALDPGCPFPDGAIIEEGQDRWVDLQVVGEVAPAPRESVRSRRPYLAEVFGRVRRCGVVVMTLGLVEAWYDRELGLYLNRAPGFWTVKKHKRRFALRLLDLRANREALEQIYALLQRFGPPGLRLVVTVSPVPMSETFTGRDVLVANSYSKSTLRAAAEEFARAHEHVDYYPSYESVTLSDRRVAFQDDLHHVANAIVDVNVRRFLDCYVRGGDQAGTAEAAWEHARQRLEGLQADLLAENARLRSELSALSERLARADAPQPRPALDVVAGLSREGQACGPDGRPLPLAAQLSGIAEVGEEEDGNLVVSGWAVDRGDGQRRVTLVALVDGRPAAQCVTEIPRPDVARALSMDAPEAGFRLAFERPAGKGKGVVRVFALGAAGGARELDYNPQLFHLGGPRPGWLQRLRRWRP